MANKNASRRPKSETCLPKKATGSFYKPVPLEKFYNEKIWQKHDFEPAECYALFKAHLETPPTERDYDKLAKLCTPPISPKTVYGWRMRWQWIPRMNAYDNYVANKNMEKVTEKAINFSEQATIKTQKIVMLLADKMVKALEEDDDKKLEQLMKKMQPFLKLFIGYGEVGNFLLKAYETFNGTKANFTADVKAQILHWGTQAVPGEKNITPQSSPLVELDFSASDE